MEICLGICQLPRRISNTALQTGAGGYLLITMLEKLNLFCLVSLITGATNVKIDGSVLEEKSPFKMLGLSFSSKLDCNPHIASIAQTASKKTGALIRPMKFLSAAVVVCLHKSTIQPCTEHRFHTWAVPRYV